MSYTMDVGIILGTSKTGLQALLRMQLVDSDGSDLGSPIADNPPTSIVTEIGDGNYLWHYISFPTNFRGGIKVYDNSDPGVVLSFVAVNPEDVEKIQTENNIEVNVGRSDANFIVRNNNVYDSLEQPKVMIRTGVK